MSSSDFIHAPNVSEFPLAFYRQKSHINTHNPFTQKINKKSYSSVEPKCRSIKCSDKIEHWKSSQYHPTGQVGTMSIHNLSVNKEIGPRSMRAHVHASISVQILITNLQTRKELSDLNLRGWLPMIDYLDKFAAEVKAADISPQLTNGLVWWTFVYS